MKKSAETPFQPGVVNNLKFDLPSGLVVFLVALPLCLGIALASGAPLFAGVIAGVIGGTVVSLLSGSEVSVSGPAAGLAVIVASAIQSLGSFEVFLAAVALSGLLQIAFGFLRAGIIGDYVPNCVIKGMLAAIGIVIILKQIPHALGRDTDYEGDFSFRQITDHENTLSEIGKALGSLSPEAMIISAVSLLILLGWERPALKRFAFFKLIPAPLVVVFFGIALNESFEAFGGDFYLKSEEGHLVSLPVAASLTEFFGQFTFPKFGALLNREVYTTALTIAVVGSLESLLSLEAADKLDPHRRISSTNRELKAQGVGNMISGLIGGLPITSVVVRTSANVYAGAQTRMSSFFHGLLLLAAVLLVPGLLNRIPLASLAAILIVIGYKLAKVSLFKEMYRMGNNQFLPFAVTIIGIVFTDLLTGILIGMTVGIFFVIRANHHAAVTVVHQEGDYLMRFNKDMTFVNKSELKDKLSAIPDGANLIIDAKKSLVLDKDICDVIADFQHSSAFRDVEVELKHFHPKSRPVSSIKGQKGDHHGAAQEAVAS
jgi:MFS superfamily sulfate permease-like transporter